MINIYYSNIITYWTILPSNDWFHLRKEYSTILGTFHTLRYFQKKANKLGARTLGARSRGSKNVTYRQQTTDKKVNTEPL